MPFTNRTATYLSTLTRKPSCITSKEETSKYLQQQSIPAFEPILNFQANYSGLALTIKGKPLETFDAVIFSKDSIATNAEIYYDVLDGLYIFNCGYHITGQANFYLTQYGEFCTASNDEKADILASSFEIYIERYALRNECYQHFQDPYYYKLPVRENLAPFLGSSYKIIEECSDFYSTWLTDGQTIIETGRWIGSPGYYLHLYSTDVQAQYDIIAGLKQHKIID